jgi:hypothetical protein
MNTIKFFNNYATNSEFSSKLAKLRQELYSKGVCWTDSVNGRFDENDSFRVILYLKSINNNIDYNNLLVSECNGLILEYANKQWKPLVIPVANFNKSKISMQQINKYYQSEQYKLYEVLDATVVNLYYYDDAWRLSSTKGYDVGSYTFVEGFTYSQMFELIVSEYYKQFDFSNLSKNHCYSIAMRSDKYHLFDETKHLYSKKGSNTYLYVLQTVNLNTLKVDNEAYVGGIPYQNPVSIKSARSVAILNDYAKHAYAKYMKAYTTNQFKYKPLYGYILRSTNSTVSGAYRNILITSSLFKIIKNGLYRNRGATTNEIIAKMFANRQFKDSYAVLFHQYHEQLTKLNAIALHVCDDVSALVSTGLHISTNDLITSFSKKLINDMTREGIFISGPLNPSVV